MLDELKHIEIIENKRYESHFEMEKNLAKV